MSRGALLRVAGAVALFVAAPACAGRSSGGEETAGKGKATVFAADSPCRLVETATLERLVGSRLSAGPVEQAGTGLFGPQRACRYGFEEEIGFNVEVADGRLPLDRAEAAMRARPAGEAAALALPGAEPGWRAWYSESGMYAAVHLPDDRAVTIRAVMWESNPKRRSVPAWLAELAKEAGRRRGN